MFDVINNPEHYAKASTTCSIKYEPYELAELYNFSLGCAIKYILRAPYKGHFVEDFGKARWFLNRIKEQFDKSESVLVMALPSNKSLYIFDAFRKSNVYIHALINSKGSITPESVRTTISLIDCYISEHQDKDKENKDESI